MPPNKTAAEAAGELGGAMWGRGGKINFIEYKTKLCSGPASQVHIDLQSSSIQE